VLHRRGGGPTREDDTASFRVALPNNCAVAILADVSAQGWLYGIGTSSTVVPVLEEEQHPASRAAETITVFVSGCCSRMVRADRRPPVPRALPALQQQSSEAAVPPGAGSRRRRFLDDGGGVDDDRKRPRIASDAGPSSEEKNGWWQGGESEKKCRRRRPHHGALPHPDRPSSVHDPRSFDGGDWYGAASYYQPNPMYHPTHIPTHYPPTYPPSRSGPADNPKPQAPLVDFHDSSYFQRPGPRRRSRADEATVGALASRDKMSSSRCRNDDNDGGGKENGNGSARLHGRCHREGEGKDRSQHHPHPNRSRSRS
jgi:hypothetical protein